ncbi:hypothetical protein BaRGS_00017473 [Batillaria attramentaria]|uniref:Secreted protein n=1 Tax=Batillaria attramentaria TaxID=370345 RepID=A0ABD0KWS9_9CAEN
MKISLWPQFLPSIVLLVSCLHHHVFAESYRSYYSRIFNRRLPGPVSTVPPVTRPPPPAPARPPALPSLTDTVTSSMSGVAPVPSLGPGELPKSALAGRGHVGEFARQIWRTHWSVTKAQMV